jgi:hypothetical protein
MPKPVHDRDELALSHLALRKGLGMVGLLLPSVLIIGSLAFVTDGIQRSISFYYYIPYLGTVLVGSLCAIGAFLVFYRGYSTVPEPFRRLPDWISRHMTDAKLTTLAGLAAVITALVPTCRYDAACEIPVSATIHFIAAAVFLAAVATLSIWSFTQSDRKRADWDRAKPRENMVYVTCGVIIFISILGCAIIFATGTTHVGPVAKPVFWLECLAVTAFSISWLVKGKAVSDMLSLAARTQVKKP